MIPIRTSPSIRPGARRPLAALSIAQPERVAGRDRPGRRSAGRGG